MTTKTYFIRGWAFDGTVWFIQYYGEIAVCKFIVKMKTGYSFIDFC